MELATPLNRLGDVAGGGYLPIGGVGVGGADVAGGAEYFAHVFGEVEAIGVLGTVFLDGQRAGGDGLGRVPGNQPKRGVMTTGEVTASNLQVAAVDEPLVEGNCAVGYNLFERTATHGIISAFHHGAGFFISETDGAVFCVVDGGPNAACGLDACLITVRIEFRLECFVRILLNGGVLVQGNF